MPTFAMATHCSMRNRYCMLWSPTWQRYLTTICSFKTAICTITEQSYTKPNPQSTPTKASRMLLNYDSVGGVDRKKLWAYVESSSFENKQMPLSGQLTLYCDVYGTVPQNPCLFLAACNRLRLCICNLEGYAFIAN